MLTFWFQVMKSGSAEGLALSMFLLEVLTFSVSMCYHARMGYPFFTYGEGVFILAQCTFDTALIGSVIYLPFC